MRKEHAYTQVVRFDPVIMKPHHVHVYSTRVISKLIEAVQPTL